MAISYRCFICLLIFLSSGSVGPIFVAVSKEMFPIAISGTSVGMVNLFPFIGAVSTAGSHGQTAFSTESFQYMFLICTPGAALSLAIAFCLKETLNVKNDPSRDS